MNPRVFVSHASEDKDRFVTNFAEKLRENGIDAWLDKWEIKPGDSLVDKIFEEGLKNAEAVLIVLSSNSIVKPWVQDELNASVVSRISKGTRIIPIVLDDCEVPMALKHLLWEPIRDTANYESSFSRIVSSITGVNDKPPLGDLPAHVASTFTAIGGLAKSDNHVLKASCEYIIGSPHSRIDPDSYFTDKNSLGLSKQEIKDCVEVLEKNRYLNVKRTLGGGCSYSVSMYGFDKYANAYIENYEEYINEIVALIVNENIKSNSQLAKATGISIVVVNHILNVLEANDHLKLSKTVGGGINIHHIAATLRRAMS